MIPSCKILAFCLSTLLFTYSYSQSFEHRKFKYDWDDEIKISLAQSERYNGYDAVILHEETTLDIGLQHIKRYQVIQFNNERAIESHNLFRIPIVMDPHEAAIQNIHRHDSASFPKLLYEKINFFDARIIRKGEFVKAILDEVAFRREERTGEYLLPYYVHYFYVRNLEPGDQLEVIISHHWPLNTIRYYINEIIPKQESYITIKQAYLDKINIYTNDSLCKLISSEKSEDGTAYKVVYEDLLPINPQLSPFVNTLPRIEFYYDKTAERSNKFFGADVIDTTTWRKYLYWWVRRIDPLEPRTWEVYDDQSYRTTLFYKKLKALAPDTTDGANLMSFIHNYTADHLDFKNDFNFFIHEEPGFVDMGTYLQKGILRESARYTYYYHMLDRIDDPYYWVFLQDRRVFCLDTSIFTPFSVDYTAYGMYNNDSAIYIFYPKGHRFGWYTNELPFYFRGEKAFMVPQTIPRKMYEREDYLIGYPLIYLEPTPYNSNKKVNKSVVEISLGNKTSSIESEIFLSGQFSTLTRGYYQYGWMDSTISPTYYANIHKKVPGSITKLITADKNFPFPHSFTVTTLACQNIFTTIDGAFIIDLSHLINIHYEDLHPAYFKSDFRHDFMGKEEYIIELNFDQLVEIENLESYTKEVKTDGLLFSSSLVKLADNQYGLKVVWDIREEKTVVKNLTVLQEAFALIKKSTLLKIKFRKQ